MFACDTIQSKIASLFDNLAVIPFFAILAAQKIRQTIVVTFCAHQENTTADLAHQQPFYGTANKALGCQEVVFVQPKYTPC